MIRVAIIFIGRDDGRARNDQRHYCSAQLAGAFGDAPLGNAYAHDQYRASAKNLQCLFQFLAPHPGHLSLVRIAGFPVGQTENGYPAFPLPPHMNETAGRQHLIVGVRTHDQ